MRDHNHDRDDTTDIFRTLRNRPFAERDAATSWRRLRVRLANVGAAPSRRGLERFAWIFSHEGIVALAGLVLLVAVALQWSGRMTTPATEQRTPASDQDSAAPLVLLAEPDDPAGGAINPGAVASAEAPEGAGLPPSYAVDLRIVRTRAEAPPTPIAGAGGADPIGDIRATLESAFPGRFFEVTDTWAGDFAPDDATRQVPLANGRALFFESSIVADSGDIVLRNVRYGAADGPEVAAELSLQPGRVYVIGLPGSSEVLLAVRLRQQELPAPESGTDDGDR